MAGFKDVFDSNEKLDITEDFIAEYYARKEALDREKKALDEINNYIKKSLLSSGLNKAKFGNVVVSITTPNTSKFDMDKVLEFMYDRYPDFVDNVTKRVVDDSKLEELVLSGKVDKDALVDFAFVESKGTPRATYKYVGDDK